MTGRINDLGTAVEQLEFIFLERLKRRRSAAQSVVFGDAVEDVNTAIVEEGGLRDRAPGAGGTDRALLQRSFADLLDSFEAMSFRAFVFVQGHNDPCRYHIEIRVTTMG